MDLIDFVQLVSAGATVIEHHLSDGSVNWVLVRLSDERRLLISERSYRSGTKVCVEPTDEELQAARRDPWSAWNGDRSELVSGINLRAPPERHAP